MAVCAEPARQVAHIPNSASKPDSKLAGLPTFVAHTSGCGSWRCRGCEQRHHEHKGGEAGAQPAAPARSRRHGAMTCKAAGAAASEHLLVHAERRAFQIELAQVAPQKWADALIDRSKHVNARCRRSSIAAECLPELKLSSGQYGMPECADHLVAQVQALRQMDEQ